MTFELDAELAQVLAAMSGFVMPKAARDDWATLRALGEAGLGYIGAQLPEHAEIERTDVTVPSEDGASIPARWYEPAGWDRTGLGSAVVYLHGGGMICGSVEAYDRMVAAYVAEAGVPMLAVDYRLAPEHPHPVPVQDGLAAVVWLKSAGLGVDPARIAVMGDSGGGGVAAGVAVLALERGIHLAHQILIYPMLDDRNTVPDPALVPFAGWSYDDNYTGWHALLGDAIGTDAVPPSAAPARATDLTGIAPAYIEVGELDIFRDESVAYARVIAAGGTSAELHVHPGCPHGFDMAGPTTDVAHRARADRLRVLRRV